MHQEMATDDYEPDDVPRDELVSQTENAGWRLEVWKPGFWLDTYDWRIRPVQLDGEEQDDQKATIAGMGYHSIDDAKKAAVAEFQEMIRLGHLKPRLIQK